MNEVIISENYTRAVALTRSIIANAQAAQQSLYEVCKGLKEMRDGKLYKELGYQNFEDYTENEVGIKRRQAYGYISVAENLPADFVHSSAQIGVKKLELLAKLDDSNLKRLAEAEAATIAEYYSLTKKDDAQQQTPPQQPAAMPDGAFLVKVVCSELNVRTSAGTQYPVRMVVRRNEVYTIVQTAKASDGGTWGRLWSGAGWINIGAKYVKRM